MDGQSSVAYLSFGLAATVARRQQPDSYRQGEGVPGWVSDEVPLPNGDPCCLIQQPAPAAAVEAPRVPAVGVPPDQAELVPVDVKWRVQPEDHINNKSASASHIVTVTRP